MKGRWLKDSQKRRNSFGPWKMTHWNNQSAETLEFWRKAESIWIHLFSVLRPSAEDIFIWECVQSILCRAYFQRNGCCSCLLLWLFLSPPVTCRVFYFLIFNWSIIALQWYVSFCRTMKSISRVCTYMPSLLSPLPPPAHPSRRSQSTSWAPRVTQQFPTSCPFCTQ